MAVVREQEYVPAFPVPRLRPFIADYVGYRLQGFEPGIHAGLPSRHLTLIVSFGSPVDVIALPDPRQTPGRFLDLVGGLNAGPVMIRHDGNQHGVHVHISALGARALFGVPAAELASTVVSLDDVIGRLATELVDRLGETSHWTDRVAILDDVFSRALLDPAPIRDEIAFTWNRLETSGGAASISSLADEVGWSRRHLTDRFRAEFGLPPKVMGKIVRFERARGLLVSPTRPSLARVAAEAGYADQAHLARDWRELAGSSPSAWLREEVFPFVQDPDPVEHAC